MNENEEAIISHWTGRVVLTDSTNHHIMTHDLGLMILLSIMLFGVTVMDVTVAADSVEGLPVLGLKQQGGDSPLVLRQASGNSDENGLSVTNVIITACVVVFGTYILLLAAIIGTVICCFARFNCQCNECCGLTYCYKGTCSPRCTKKARVVCPKLVRDNVSMCCSYTVRNFCPCCSNPDNWDSGEFEFWIEIVVLAVVCFPFALCLLILWAILDSIQYRKFQCDAHTDAIL